jgi:sucrose synthase
VDLLLFLFHLDILQEAAVIPPFVAFAVRPNPGFWEYVKVNAEDLSVEGISVSEYLQLKEMVFDEKWYAQVRVKIF